MALNTAEKINIVHNAYILISQAEELLADKSIFDNFKIVTYPSCYTNFKDALFHFYRLSMTEDEQDIYDQYYALSEHIARLKADYFSNVLYSVSYCLEGIVLNIDNDEKRNSVRLVLHKVKDILYFIRYNGMLIASHQDRIDELDFSNCLSEVIGVISDNKLDEVYATYNQQYKDKFGTTRKQML